MIRQLLSLLSPAGPRARLTTLIFHRVLPQVDPMFPEEVDAARFDRICGWLRQWFHVLPLDQAVRHLAAGTLPARALGISFDDGYADNQQVALPILQRHGLQATFFVATGFLDGGRMWNDTVVEALRRTALPVLDLGDLGRWTLDDAAARRRAADALLPRIKYLPLAERQAVCDRIAAAAGVELPATLMMRSEQVRALADAGMQIGAHTVSHPILARQDDAAARAELGASKRRLEAISGAPVTLFAYPNGRPGADYSPANVAQARDAGFEAAFSTAWGAAGRASDPFQLPRFTPWDTGRWPFGVRLLRNLRYAAA